MAFRRRMPRRGLPMGRRGGRSMGKARLVIGLAVAGFALFSYLNSAQVNPITGEKQYLGLSPDQEIQLGLQAAPEMMMQHGGEDRDSADQQRLDRICNRLVQRSDAGTVDWAYDFHLLADPNTINAFALPGGQCFITRALYDRLTTDGQIAGVMGHEIAHVVARHGAQRMAKGGLMNGLMGAVGVAAGSAGAQRAAAMIGNMVTMKYGREDELESDRLGVDFMVDAGYDPRAMIRVMEVLAEAGGSRKQPEFFSTHPNPDNRIERIEQAIAERLPEGISPDLEP